MRASFSAVFLTAVVVAVSAVAGNHSSSNIRPDSLARVEAITSYCQKADPSSGSLYRAKLEDAVRGHSALEIESEHNSDTYARALAQANETLSQVSDRTGIKGCSEFLADKE
jgi:hypothetical protein